MSKTQSKTPDGHRETFDRAISRNVSSSRHTALQATINGDNVIALARVRRGKDVDGKSGERVCQQIPRLTSAAKRALVDAAELESHFFDEFEEVAFGAYGHADRASSKFNGLPAGIDYHNRFLCLDKRNAYLCSIFRTTGGLPA